MLEGNSLSPLSRYANWSTNSEPQLLIKPKERADEVHTLFCAPGLQFYVIGESKFRPESR